MIDLKELNIKTTFHTFTLWRGKPITDTYGNKAVVNFDNRPLFAELAALEVFKIQGYSGVWIDTYRRKFRVGLLESTKPVELPINIKEKYEKIQIGDKRNRGAWDLLLWKDGKIKFVELKRKNRDRIQQSQIDFFKAALRAGYSRDNFEILEWEIQD